MPDYQKISNRLIAELSDIIEKAQTAIEKAEEDILSDDSNPALQIFPGEKEE